MERVDKEKKRKVLEKIKKAGDSENYEVSWDDKGAPEVKKKSEIAKGKKSRGKGSRFELKVRKDLEGKGYFVDKWNNNIDLDEKKVIQAKRKYNPFKKMLVVGTGFPDFICIKHVRDDLYRVVGVEAKINGTLSKDEKDKCRVLLDQNVFSEILIASKGEKRGSINYIEFRERYGV